MSNFLARLLLALSVVPLAGCVSLDLLVRVRPDGSGEIVRTVAFRSDWLDELRKKQPQGDGAPGQDDEVYGKDDAEWEAERLGEGVRLVEATPANSETSRGLKAIYSFPDVRKLTLSVEPPSWWKGSGPSENADPIRFDFRRSSDGLATLSIRLPDKTVAGTGRASGFADRAELSALTEAERDQARLLMRGLRVTATVEAVGSMVSVEGGWRDRNRVNLLDFDFDRLLADEINLRRMKSRSISTFEEALPFLRDVSGCRVPSARIVTVSFL